MKTSYSVMLLACLALSSCASATPNEVRMPDLMEGSTTAGSDTHGLIFGTDGKLACTVDALDLFDLQAVAAMPALLDELEVGTLGEQGARRIADDLISLDGSFCTADLLPESLAVLDEARQLAGEGRTDEALDLMETHIDELNSAIGAGFKLAAPLGDQTNVERRRIRYLMEAASVAQEYGKLGSEAVYFERARSTLQEMADRDLPNAGGREALRIAIEAQLLDMQELLQDAWDWAGEAFDNELGQTLKGFDPCSVIDESALNELLGRAGMVLGTKGQTDNVSMVLEQFETAREVLSRRSKGEEVPECGQPAMFTWTQEHEFDWISNGTATTCNGRSWHLELTAELSIPEPKGVFSVSGSLDFEVDGNGVIGEPIISVDGQLVVATGTAELADEIEFDLKFIEQGKAVEITLGSNSTGTIDYGGGEIEEFGVILPGGPVITATLMPYDGCSSP